ncbi:TetR/AcrR family transcriptional regulator [Kitasatospora sp. NPDC057223]|uniref:TetR/AcrR family transcriptional regulator n=1 Tax=Kitasatospora sp. NPDC057223 TaxID=3346055 RepID=UPI003642AA97
MGRPRAFDEDQAVQAAARLFATRGYEGTSVDDLVTGLGVHRGSLYKVFGSKRGLYLTALRRHLDHEVLPLAAAVAAAPGLAGALAQAVAGYDGGEAAGLLMLSAAEQAAEDPEVAALVGEGLAALDAALTRALVAGGGEPGEATDALAAVLGATVLGLRLRGRAAGAPPPAGAVLAFAAQLTVSHPPQQ